LEERHATAKTSPNQDSGRAHDAHDRPLERLAPRWTDFRGLNSDYLGHRLRMGRTGAKRAVVAALIAVLTLTACSQVINGHPAGTTMTGAKLGALLISGARTVTSAHMEMSIDAAGLSVTAKGDEKESNGKTSASTSANRSPTSEICG
jgi:hypothetical protein